MTSEIKQQTEPRQELTSLFFTSRQDQDCLIITCTGPSDCHICIDTLYRPIINQMEDSECTGLVVDKRQILCSREEESLRLIAEAILHYTHRAVLRKLAIVTSIAYKKDDQLMLETLYQKGVNIRLFSEPEPAIRWARTYP